MICEHQAANDVDTFSKRISPKAMQQATAAESSGCAAMNDPA
jgi:hypothetical protein